MIRVGIADDHAVVRAGLRRLLSREPDLQVTGEAADGAQAFALACSGEIDLLLMDLAMPGQGGVDVLLAIRVRCPALPVLVLSGRWRRRAAPACRPVNCRCC
jgi:two-component system invasion response regulator UvrY